MAEPLELALKLRRPEELLEVLRRPVLLRQVLHQPLAHVPVAEHLTDGVRGEHVRQAGTGGPPLVSARQRRRHRRRVNGTRARGGRGRRSHAAQRRPEHLRVDHRGGHGGSRVGVGSLGGRGGCLRDGGRVDRGGLRLGLGEGRVGRLVRGPHRLRPRRDGPAARVTRRQPGTSRAEHLHELRLLVRRLWGFAVERRVDVGGELVVLNLPFGFLRPEEHVAAGVVGELDDETSGLRDELHLRLLREDDEVVVGVEGHALRARAPHQVGQTVGRLADPKLSLAVVGLHGLVLDDDASALDVDENCGFLGGSRDVRAADTRERGPTPGLWAP